LSGKWFSFWFLPRRITWRVYIAIVLLLIFVTAIITVMGIQIGLRSAQKNQGERLMLAAHALEGELAELHSIVRMPEIAQQPPAEQLVVLRQNLDPVLERVARNYPGLSLGYYSRELAATISQTVAGPDPVHEISPADFLKVYQTGKPELILVPSAGFWHGRVLLYQAYPVIRDGLLIGHVWASTDLESTMAEIRDTLFQALLMISLVLAIAFLLAWLEIRSLNRCLDMCARDIISGTPPLSLPAFPELQPVLAAIHEYTARLQAAYAAQESSTALFHTAFNSSPNLMAIICTADETCLEVNRSLLLTLGYTRDEVIGKPAGDLGVIMEPGSTVIRARAARLISDQEPLQNLEVVLCAKDGRRRTGLLSAEQIRVNGQECLLLVIADITERKELEAAMARLERLNLVGELAAGISHEVRNPMTTIRGFLQLLSGKPDCQQYRHYYALMIEELDRANSIITEFLQLGRNNIGQYKQADLNSIVAALIPLIEADAVRGDKAVHTSLAPLPELWLNEKEIRQVILNLVRNGLEAMGPGGCVEVRTFVDTASGEIVLSVQDQGPGIPPEIMEKLGTPFFSTKEQGTGLGLAVCYSIAARHRARIEIESGAGGTRVNVRFSPGYGEAGEQEAASGR